MNRTMIIAIRVRTWPDIFTSDDAARFPAAAVGGGIACTLSMPFDTCKTCMQGDVERTKFTSMTQTFSTLLKEGGVMSFFRGIQWRYGRQVCAIMLLDKIRQELSPVLFPGSFANSDEE